MASKSKTLSKTFVLVHGAWHGGWCWREVAAILRNRGHAVFTPTQTGVGERAHLISKSITLDTFVADILNVITFEDLSDIVLVGHSFGGSTISGIADRMRERVRSLFYLDALMVEDGGTPFGLFSKEVVAERTDAAMQSGGIGIPAPTAASFGIADAALAAMVDRRLTPHPLSTFQSPLKLANKLANGLPACYIVCTDPIRPPLQTSRDVAANKMPMLEIKTGHDAMVTEPGQLAEMLDAYEA